LDLRIAVRESIGRGGLRSFFEALKIGRLRVSKMKEASRSISATFLEALVDLLKNLEVGR